MSDTDAPPTREEVACVLASALAVFVHESVNVISTRPLVDALVARGWLRVSDSVAGSGRHALGEACDICDGRGFDFIGRPCRRYAS